MVTAIQPPNGSGINKMKKAAPSHGAALMKSMVLILDLDIAQAIKEVSDLFVKIAGFLCQLGCPGLHI